MKFITTLSVFILCVLAVHCKKSADTAAPAPPVVITDTGSISIATMVKKEFNAFEITYNAIPPAGDSYTNIFLIWSTSADFTGLKDSIAVGATAAAVPGSYRITKLQQTTAYYVRIGATLKNKRLYSIAKSFITDLFKLVTLGYSDPPRGFSKDDTTIIFTNLQPVAPVAASDAKIYFGAYECTLVSDQGLTIAFNVPRTVPSGKYKMKVSYRGVDVFWPDSVEVLRGQWDIIANPDIPGNPNASFSALLTFGTCYSAQKGYIIGGQYFNGPSIGFPNSQWPDYLLEFDGSQKTWSKRTVTNPHYFEDPHCYYYNNGIYVITGHESYIINVMNDVHAMNLKKIHRLDLSTLTWSTLQDVPYPTMGNMASFELNNEFYVGMGLDSANRTACCGTPIPSRKFWKYNPASGVFTALADFPGSYEVFPASFSLNGKGYVFYGAIPMGDPAGSVTFRQELWEYNPGTNSWTPVALPSTGGPPAGEKYQVTVYNNKVYFISAQVREIAATGYTYRAFNPSIEWDPAASSWKKVAFPYDPRVLKRFYQQGNKAYYVSHATGYFDSTPLRSFSFEIEQ